jgi:hypothetical protein
MSEVREPSDAEEALPGDLAQRRRCGRLGVFRRELRFERRLYVRRIAERGRVPSDLERFKSISAAYVGTAEMLLFAGWIVGQAKASAAGRVQEAL